MGLWRTSVMLAVMKTTKIFLPRWSLHLEEKIRHQSDRSMVNCDLVPGGSLHWTRLPFPEVVGAGGDKEEHVAVQHYLDVE